MMFKKAVIMLAAVFFLSACNEDEMPEEGVSDIYSLALETLIEADEALSADKQYIAIDMEKEGFEQADEQNKQEIISLLEDTYDMDVMNATLDDLHDEGLYESSTMVLDGILLNLNHAEFGSDLVFFEGSKYKAGDGGIGLEITVEKMNGEWEVTEVNEAFIS